MKMINVPSVLVCPLNWGTGHATRCVPVINKFLENGFRVILAADGKAYDFLTKEFPGLRVIRFSGTNITYTSGRNLSWKILVQTPYFLYGIIREHFLLKQLIRRENPSVVFSDNRYGLWNKKIKSVFMTHQLSIILPRKWQFLSGWVNGILHWFIRQFDECWVPDNEEDGLAGVLSHPPNLNFPVHYIGILSRFSTMKPDQVSKIKPEFNFIAILSGPEPQRSILEEIIIQKIRKTRLKGNLVTGRIGENCETTINNEIRIFPHLETEKMYEMIMESGMVICRPGYSSLMDLVSIGMKAVLIPTPGQTEQEYLADHLMKKNIFFSISQEEFDPEIAIQRANDYSGILISNDLKSMEMRILNLNRAITG